MSRKTDKMLCLLLTSMIIASIIAINNAYASPPTIYLAPSSITGLDPGARFNVTARLDNVADLFAWQIRISYSPTILNVTNAWHPIWDPEYVFFGKTDIRVTNFFPDYVLVGSSLLLGTPTFNGNGTLAIIEFEVKGIGYSDLSFVEVDTFLLDSVGDEIPYTALSGWFDNRPPIPKATLSVDPPAIVDPSLVPSSNFQVNITIADATDVYSFEFNLGYDSTTLNIVNVTLGNFFPPSPNSSSTIIIDNMAGNLLVNASLVAPEPPRSGSGTLAVILFHVEDLGISNLDLYNTRLLDQTGLPLEQNPPEDGFFNNVLLAKLYIDPSMIIDPQLTIGDIVAVNVTIDDIEDLYSYEFTLDYNTEMLTCIGVFIHPILNETNFTTNMMVDDDLGQIWVRVRYYPPASPITAYSPEALVTLTFKVDATDSSLLDLHDTMLEDAASMAIPHDVSDGLITVVRDVAITNVEVSSTQVVEGQEVNITVTARNKGNATESFNVTAYYNTTPIETQQVSDLAPNTEVTLLFTWNTSGVVEGNYTIKGEAGFVPFEEQLFNTANNIFLDGTVQIITIIPDVAILNVTADPNATYADPLWPVNISVTVKNEGMGNVTFDLSVYYNDTNLIETRMNINLTENEERTLTFTWNTSLLEECHIYKIGANATVLPFEDDTEDNRFEDGYVKIKLMGDITGDGNVDIRDLAIIAQAFGSYPGHPSWDERADLNRDLVVDIRDLAIAASNFGRTC